MDEQAAFEARAVLAPRRARLSRITLLIPVVALVAIAWAGASGVHHDDATAVIPEATAPLIEPTAVTRPSMSPGPFPRPVVPATAVGFVVQGIDDVQQQDLSHDQVVAVSGWYQPTSITRCPPQAVINGASAAPELDAAWDSWAFCERTGILFATRPDDAVVALQSSVPVRMIRGVVMPPELERVGWGATQVVLLGHFVESSDRCNLTTRCGAELLVDYVAWTPDA